MVRGKLRVAFFLIPALTHAVGLQLPEDFAQFPLSIRVYDAAGGVRQAVITAEKPEFSVVGPGPWRLEVEAPSLWPRTFSLAGSQLEGATLKLWWKSAVIFRLESTPAGDVSPTVLVFPEPGSEDGALPLTCQREDPAWRCEAPAGRWRAKIQVAGSASLRILRLELPAGETTDLGALSLQPEARVRGSLSPPPSPSWPVRLMPVKASQPLPRVEEDPFFEEEAMTDRNGEFFFGGLQRGTYELRVDSPCAPRSLRFSLGKGGFLALPPLQVSCGGPLSVRVSPQLEGRWWLSLTPHGGSRTILQPLAKAEVAPGATWVSSPLPEGLYKVGLFNPQGEVWFSDPVWVGPEGGSVDLGAHGFVARGQVLLGDRPWPGAFKLQSDDPPVVIRRAEASALGAFAVFLPHAGSWTVTPELPDGVINGGVSVRIRAGQKAKVVFPDTSLSGQLAGSPPRKAPVSVGVVEPRRGVSAYFQLDEQKTSFFAVGLPEGTYDVQAFSPEVASPVLSVAVEEGKRQDLAIPLEPVSSFELRVIREGEPVPGAVVFYAAVGAGRPVLIHPAIPVPTDERGIARLPLPRGTAAVRGLVFAPSFAVTDFSFRAPLPASAEVPMLDEGGTVVLPQPVLDEGAKKGQYMLVINGFFLDLGIGLDTWLDTHGSVPGLENEMGLPLAPPGDHRLCFVAHEDLFRATAVDPPSSVPCTAGKLAPHGLLRLRPPKGPW